MELINVGALELSLRRKMIFEDLSVVLADSAYLIQALVSIEWQLLSHVF